MDELKPCLLDLPMAIMSHIMTFLASEPPNDLPNVLLVCHWFRAAVEPVLAPWLAQVPLAITTAKLEKAREAGMEEQLLAFLGRQALVQCWAVLEVDEERSLRRVLDSLSPGSCGRGLCKLQLQSRRLLVESRWCSFGLAAVPEVRNLLHACQKLAALSAWLTLQSCPSELWLGSALAYHSSNPSSYSSCHCRHHTGAPPQRLCGAAAGAVQADNFDCIDPHGLGLEAGPCPRLTPGTPL